MGKRKSESTEEEIKNKIRKLEEKLRKIPRHRRRAIRSAPGSESEASVTTEDGTPRTRATPVRRRLRILSSSEASDQPSSPERQRSPILSVPPPKPSAQPESTTPGTSAEKIPDELELDEDILQILGDAPKDEVALGKPVHKDIASRWLEILSKGIPKEGKDKLLQEYLVPSNCELLIAPALNLEVKAALSEVMVKRDFSLMQKQKQLGVAISALAEATTLIIANETSKQKILKPISDACRILCDSHFMETKQRRNFVISATNTTMKDTLIDAKRDKLLFGENVSEKLKAAKTIQRSGDALKTTNKPNLFTKSNFAYKNKNRLNAKPQHRKTDSKSTSEASYRNRPYQRAPQRSYGSNTRKSDRSPTRKTQKKR